MFVDICIVLGIIFIKHKINSGILVRRRERERKKEREKEKERERERERGGERERKKEKTFSIIGRNSDFWKVIRLLYQSWTLTSI